ncbi:hypothetical protein PVAP13_2KG347921 [Panicum virgatum]|uniref:Uncharacterized protein n=1 Tax=Panicum virgatum TaxID=38727 RepID=A0A8T0W5R7_PANVG|nr:hypothetical protein PVAP13_2KG347921 [Panicum virgatum]
MAAGSNTPLPRSHRSNSPPVSPSPPPAAIAQPQHRPLLPLSLPSHTLIVLNPRSQPTLTAQSQTHTALHHSSRPVSRHLLRLAVSREAGASTAQDGAPKCWRPVSSAASCWFATVLALHLAGPSIVPSLPPPPRARLYGRMLRHDALRPLQRAAPGVRPRGRAHRRLHQRRRAQGQQGNARYGAPREMVLMHMPLPKWPADISRLKELRECLRQILANCGGVPQSFAKNDIEREGRRVTF